MIGGDDQDKELSSSGGSIISVVISDHPQCNVRGILLDMNPFGKVLKYVVFSAVSIEE